MCIYISMSIIEKVFKYEATELPVYPEIFPVFSYDKTSQHSKWMDNLNVD